MLNIYLIRHGQSVNNTQPEIIGGRSNETPLTLKGIHQATLLGRSFFQRKIIFDKMYSSRALRAIQTATLVSKEINFPIEKITQTNELLELDQGKWQGEKRKKIYDPSTIYEIETSNGHHRPPKGESQRDVEQRMFSWIDKAILENEKKDMTIGIFGHGTAFKCLLRRILDMSSIMTVKVSIDNTSVTHLRYNSRGWHLEFLNNTGHLLGECK